MGCEPNPELWSQSPYFLGPPPRPHLSLLRFLCKSPESMRGRDGPFGDHPSSVWQNLPTRTLKGWGLGPYHCRCLMLSELCPELGDERAQAAKPTISSIPLPPPSLTSMEPHWLVVGTTASSSQLAKGKEGQGSRDLAPGLCSAPTCHVASGHCLLCEPQCSRLKDERLVEFKKCQGLS